MYSTLNKYFTIGIDKTWKLWPSSPFQKFNSCFKQHDKILLSSKSLIAKPSADEQWIFKIVIYATPMKSKVVITNSYHFVAKMVFLLLFFWTLAASCTCENDDFWFEKNGYFNCCRNPCFLSQKSTNNTIGMVSRQCWNLQVVFSRLSPVWLYNLNVHKLTNATLTGTFEHFFY